MAKRYIGEDDPVLDALYEELDATGRKTKADRRKRRQLKSQIRELRKARVSGGLGGLFENLVDVLGKVNVADTTGMAQPLSQSQIDAYISGREETGKGDILEQLGYGKVGDVLRRPRADRFPRIKERWEEGFPRLRRAAENVGEGFLRQHISKPQIDQFVDETVAGKDVFPTPAQDVLGRNFGFRVPPTAAEVAPEIEEIEVTAEKRPEIVEDQWVPWKSLMRVSKQRELPVGTFSKKNQRYNPETRQWEIRVLPELMNEAGYAQGGKLSGQADRLARAGRGDDTMLMHVTPDEVAGLASLAPGMMTINPETGLPEAGWFRNLLGTAAPFLMAMIPGVGPVLAGAMGGGLGSLIKGGDLKDALLGAGLGALGGKVFGGMGEAGADVIAGEAATGAMASPEGFTDFVANNAVGDIATQAGITPDLLSGTITPAIQSGVNPSIAFSQAGVNPESLGVFKSGLTDIARETVPKTFKEMSFGQKMAGIKGGGFGGLQDALMTPAGLGYITGTGLSAQHENQQAFEDYLLAMEEHRKQRARDIAEYYSENVPYAGGGSIYKNRYINGNWS